MSKKTKALTIGVGVPTLWAALATIGMKSYSPGTPSKRLWRAYFSLLRRAYYQEYTTADMMDSDRFRQIYLSNLRSTPK